MGTIRFIIALFIAKCAKVGLRLLHRNATYLPGKIALKLCPDFLARVAKPAKIIAVTGTNGKTTVSNMLRDCLTALGEDVLSNRLGSNIAAGIATTLMDGVTCSNRAKYRTAVLEVDERYSPKILPHVKPSLLIVTNLFRDSIMRNAYPEFIKSFLERAIPDGTPLLLNADDPISSAIKPNNPRRYFGIASLPGDTVELRNLVSDMRICPVCHEELVYDYRRYHHIGRCRCPNCGYTSPDYDYTASDVNLADMTMTVRFPDETAAQYKILSESVFNIYNVTTVVAALGELGYTHEQIAPALGEVAIVESRFNETRVGKSNIVMQMSKGLNAIATSRACEYAASRPGKKEIILMVSCIADSKNWSENVCWLYDCDMETLNNSDITRIVAAGPRAKDFYLRLLFAGVPEERLRCVQRETDAPSELNFDGDDVFILYAADAIDIAFRVKERAIEIAAKLEGAK